MTPMEIYAMKLGRDKFEAKYSEATTKADKEREKLSALEILIENRPEGEADEDTIAQEQMDIIGINYEKGYWDGQAALGSAVSTFFRDMIFAAEKTLREGSQL